MGLRVGCLVGMIGAFVGALIGAIVGARFGAVVVPFCINATDIIGTVTFLAGTVKLVLRDPPIDHDANVKFF